MPIFPRRVHPNLHKGLSLSLRLHRRIGEVMGLKRELEGRESLDLKPLKKLKKLLSFNNMQVLRTLIMELSSWKDKHGVA